MSIKEEFIDSKKISFNEGKGQKIWSENGYFHKT